MSSRCTSASAPRGGWGDDCHVALAAERRAIDVANESADTVISHRDVRCMCLGHVGVERNDVDSLCFRLLDSLGQERSVDGVNSG